VDKRLGQRVLERAVEKFGEAQLAKLLDISETTLRLYLGGKKNPPEAFLLHVVDLVIDAGGDGPASRQP
jgi:hypothetical protein